MITKALILIFGYDILLGELRDDDRLLNIRFLYGLFHCCRQGIHGLNIIYIPARR